MRDVIKHFVRSPVGEWVCVTPVELQTPSGRVQVDSGTRFTRDTLFMGLELARILDEQEEKDRAKR